MSDVLKMIKWALLESPKSLNGSDILIDGAFSLSQMTVYILGAGPAGLSLAYYLSKINVSVEVFEATDCLGGMARTWTWNDFHVETGPHLLHTPLKEIWDDWKSILGDNLIQKEF